MSDNITDNVEIKEDKKTVIDIVFFFFSFLDILLKTLFKYLNAFCAVIKNTDRVDKTIADPMTLPNDLFEKSPIKPNNTANGLAINNNKFVMILPISSLLKIGDTYKNITVYIISANSLKSIYLSKYLGSEGTKSIDIIVNIQVINSDKLITHWYFLISDLI